MTDSHVIPDNGTVTEPTKEALRGTKAWVKLVGILMFVGAALTVLGAVAVAAAGQMGGSKFGTPHVALIVATGLVYLVIAAVYTFLGIYLLSYSRSISQLLNDGKVASLEMALQSQQKFWRLAGILALIMVVISVLGIIAAIVIPLMVNR